jgi:drug/metabolite transporter (DMT)-like permease
MVINRVGPLSCAKVVGLLYAILGLVTGGIISVVSPFLGQARPEAGPIFGVVAIVVFPVLYGVVGFVMTVIMAWLYNALAGLVGGIEIDLR